MIFTYVCTDGMILQEKKKNIPQQEGKALLPTPNDLQGAVKHVQVREEFSPAVDMEKHAPPIQALLSI